MSSELPKSVMRFHPRKAVKALSRCSTDPVVRSWELARLIAWAILDQRPGKRRLEAGTGRSTNRKALIRRNAERAGQLYLAIWLDHHGKAHTREGASADKLSERTKLAFYLFLASGGFSKLAEFNGKRLLTDIRKPKVLRELLYVYRIVDAVCRMQRYAPNASQTIECARKFVQKCAPEQEKTLSDSAIEKIWNRYRASAPIIYAVFFCLKRNSRHPASIHDTIARLHLLTGQKRANRIIGYAAYASDALSRTRAIGVRVQDFAGALPQYPPGRPFTDEELLLLHNFDRNSPIA